MRITVQLTATCLAALLAAIGCQPSTQVHRNGARKAPPEPTGIVTVEISARYGYSPKTRRIVISGLDTREAMPVPFSVGPVRLWPCILGATQRHHDGAIRIVAEDPILGKRVEIEDLVLDEKSPPTLWAFKDAMLVVYSDDNRDILFSARITENHAKAEKGVRGKLTDITPGVVTPEQSECLKALVEAPWVRFELRCGDIARKTRGFRAIDFAYCLIELRIMHNKVAKQGAVRSQCEMAEPGTLAKQE